MEKGEVLKYIKQFTSISIKNICTDLKVDYTNDRSSRASKRVLKKKKKEIEKRIKVLEGKYENNN